MYKSQSVKVSSRGFMGGLCARLFLGWVQPLAHLASPDRFAFVNLCLGSLGSLSNRGRYQNRADLQPACWGVTERSLSLLERICFLKYLCPHWLLPRQSLYHICPIWDKWLRLAHLVPGRMEVSRNGKLAAPILRHGINMSSLIDLVPRLVTSWSLWDWSTSSREKKGTDCEYEYFPPEKRKSSFKGHKKNWPTQTRGEHANSNQDLKTRNHLAMRRQSRADC